MIETAILHMGSDTLDAQLARQVNAGYRVVHVAVTEWTRAWFGLWGPLQARRYMVVLEREPQR